MSADRKVAHSAGPIDWGQVRSHGGEPCFAMRSDGLCLRAKWWDGHSDDGRGAHPFVSLDELLAAKEAALRDLLAALQRARGYIQSDYTAADGTDLTGGLIAQMDAAIEAATGSAT